MDTTGGVGRRRVGPGWRAALWGGAAALLALPWVAMRFTAEVDWSPFDFVLFGLMLACACGAIELAVRTLRSTTARTGAVAAVVVAFVLVWALLAVGI